MGLPGAGKTTLSLELAKALNAVHFNADEVRKKISKDLGFSIEDRVEHAKRMGVLCDIVVRSGNYAIADFVCPTRDTRLAFGADAFIIWVNRIETSRYEDTNNLFEAPDIYHIEVTKDQTPEYWTNIIKSLV